MSFHQKFGFAFLTILIVGVILFIIVEMSVEKPIVGYYIGATYTENSITALQIRVDIENGIDSYINCPNMTREQVYVFVDSLNSKLRENPRLRKLRN